MSEVDTTTCAICDVAAPEDSYCYGCESFIHENCDINGDCFGNHIPEDHEECPFCHGMPEDCNC